MKVCIYGAGAIGGYVGVQLARAGVDVSLVARGPHLEAMKANGLKLLINDEERVEHIPCSDNPADLGPQDYVIVALKGHSVPGVVDAMQPLLGNDTAVVTAVNGVPYWYYYKHGDHLEGKTLESIDPGGKQWTGLRPERAIGCIVYPATEVVAPGVIKHVYGDKFPLGEPSGEITDRVTKLSEAFEAGGLRAPVLPNIRDELWLKLWGNLCFNPISALTHATLVDLCQFPATRALSAKMMAEAETIAEKLGVSMRISIERRIAGAEKVGAHKTSMLIDVEQGRPIELDALMGAVIELGELTQTPTPHISAVYACTSLLANTLATSRGRLVVSPAE